MAHRLLSLTLTELSSRRNESIHKTPKGRRLSSSALAVVLATAIDDAVGASKGNVVGISPVCLWSFVASSLLTLIGMVMVIDLRRLAWFES
jgi:hypothetical protein